MYFHFFETILTEFLNYDNVYKETTDKIVGDD